MDQFPAVNLRRSRSYVVLGGEHQSTDGAASFVSHPHPDFSAFPELLIEVPEHFARGSDRFRASPGQARELCPDLVERLGTVLDVKEKALHVDHQRRRSSRGTKLSQHKPFRSI